MDAEQEKAAKVVADLECGNTPDYPNRGWREDIIAAALREAKAQAFEEAGKLLADGLSEDCGCSAELQSRCKAKAAALRQPDAAGKPCRED